MDASSSAIEINGGFSLSWILLAVPTALAGVAALFWERLRYMSLSAEQVSVHAYPAMRRLASRLPIPLYEGYTPSQFADVLGQALKINSQRFAFVESAILDVSVLARAYEDVSYRKQPKELPEKALLIRSWGRIRRQLWFLWLEEKIRSLRIPFIISDTRSQDGGVH